MPVVVSILIAVTVAVALVLGSRLWFDRVQKRQHAQRIGIEVLNTRRWREALDLLVKALASEGMEQTAEVTSAGGAPMAERILMRGGSRILLIYKHGTTYRIGGPALLDAERRRQEAALDEVIIATLGTVDDDAGSQASRMKITCFDGASVWAKVRDAIDETTRDGVTNEAEALVDRPRRLATIGAAVLGLAIVFWGGNLDELSLGSAQESDGATMAATPPATPALPRAVSPATQAEARVAPELAVPLERPTAPAQDASIDPRIALAKAVTALPEVERAAWSSGSTMVVSLRPRISVDIGAEKACALSADHPVLRDVRLQVEAYGGGDVRWRRCG